MVVICLGYVYTLNNPIKYIDPDGRDVVVLNAPKGAKNREHMGAIIQDGKGQWHYMTMGATGRNVLRLSSGTANGGMTLLPLKTTNKEKALKIARVDTDNAEYTQEISFSTSVEMDDKIFNNAQEMQESVNSGDVKYSPLSNNCADAVVNTISSGTGVQISTTSDPRPNSVYNDIKNNQSQTQEKINNKIANNKTTRQK